MSAETLAEARKLRDRFLRAYPERAAALSDARYLSATEEPHRVTIGARIAALAVLGIVLPFLAAAVLLGACLRLISRTRTAD